MAYEGQELVSHNGFRVKLIQITEEMLQMEASYSGEGGFPREHYHPQQDEHFEVLEGAVRAMGLSGFTGKSGRPCGQPSSLSVPIATTPGQTS